MQTTTKALIAKAEPLVKAVGSARRGLRRFCVFSSQASTLARLRVAAQNVRAWASQQVGKCFKRCRNVLSPLIR